MWPIFGECALTWSENLCVALQVPYALESLKRVCGWDCPVDFGTRHFFHFSNAVKFGLLSDRAKQLLFCPKTGEIEGRTGCSAAPGIAQRVSPLLSLYYMMQVGLHSV